MSGPGRHFLVRADEIHMGNMSELAPIKLINLGYYECVAESAAPVRRTIARRTTAGDIPSENLNKFRHQSKAKDNGVPLRSDQVVGGASSTHVVSWVAAPPKSHLGKMSPWLNVLWLPVCWWQ